MLRDRKTDRTFSIGEFEWNILKTFNGTQSINQLKENLKRIINAKDLEKFILLTMENGLLESEKVKKSFNIFQIKFPLLFLSEDLKKNRFTAVTMKIILTGPVVFLLFFLLFLGTKLDFIVQTTLMTNYLRLETLPYYLVSIFIIGFIHESAHAVTMINLGGPVFNAGFMLNYFHPAFYVDITGVNKLKKKRERLLVWIAGISIQLLILGPMLCLTYIQASPLFLNYFLLVFNGINCGMIIFNLLFVIKLDGYYILSELLNMTDLREMALAFLAGKGTTHNLTSNLIYFVMGVINKLYVPLFVINIVITIVTTFFAKESHSVALAMEVGFSLSILLLIIRGLILMIRRER